MNILPRFVLLSFLLILTSIAKGEEIPELDASQKIKAAVFEEIDNDLFPGVVVIVGRKDSILFHDAYGDSEISPSKTPMKKDSIFDLASITKVVATGTAAAICLDRRKLKLSDLARDSLPGMNGKNTEKITIEHLGTHTSGIANPVYFRKAQGEEMLNLIKTSPSIYSVGSRYKYSDTNAILLGLIVEEQTGSGLGGFCEKEIFKPLGMLNTKFGPLKASPQIVPTSIDVKGTRAVGVINDEQGRFANRPVGNAGLFSTATDLGIFCQLMLGKGKRKDVRIISENMFTEITKNRLGSKLSPRGFCWRVYEGSSHKLEKMTDRSFGHTGWTGQSMWIDVEKNLFVIVLTNRTIPKRVYGKKSSQQYHARKRIGDALLQNLIP